MKKFLTSLIAVSMVAALGIGAFAAREESKIVPIFDCDTAFGAFAADRNEKTEGAASASAQLSGSSFVAEKKIGEAVDVSGCDTIAFDLYVSDTDKVAGINNIFFEVSSSGKCDEEELQWDFTGQLRDDRLEDGWNTIYLDIGGATDIGFDDTALNYFRFYTTSFTSQAAGLVIKLDNIRGCCTGGEDYSDLNLDSYKGDNADKNVIIQGQPEPDLNDRDRDITKTEGFKKKS